MMVTAAYLCVSTEEQRQRQTIATQRQFAERYFAQRGIEAVRYYVDDGISGMIPFGARPAGQRLLVAGRHRPQMAHRGRRVRQTPPA